MKMHQVQAIVPMKGHSERVPGKNMKNFHGRPLYHAIMDTLLSSESISNIVVDTDSADIAEDVKKFFPETIIIRRPEHLWGDTVSTNKLIQYDIQQLDGNYFLQTHCTNPLLTAETIQKAVKCYFEGLDQYDSLFSVTRWQTRLYWENGESINHNVHELIRTQDLPSVFEENSNFYLFSKESFTQAGFNRIGNKPRMFEVDKLESVDIDEPEDWEIAEILYEKRVKA